MNRTGSMASRVPPAVTSTRRPARSPAGARTAAAAATMRAGAGRLGGQRREGQRPDEARGPDGEDRHDVGAGVDEAAADLDGLVGGDAAGDAEHDPPAGEPLQGCYLIDRSTTSGRSKTIFPA